LVWIALAAAWLGAMLAPPPARASDIEIHGLLDFVAPEHSAGLDLNTLARGDSQFDPYGLRLFVNGSANDHLAVYSQLVVRDAVAPYLEGAYASWTPWSTRDAHVLAGKIPWAVGTYAPRTYSNKNPLIGSPLIYQYHTNLVWYALPPSADALIASSGTGQYGVNYFGVPMSRGMAIVDDSYWDVGVTVTGSERPLEYAVGVTAGTPGWANPSQDENSGKTVLGRVGLAPFPSLRVGVSGAYGPYLVDGLAAKLPQGKDVNDYHQELGMADAEVLVGHLELRGEGAWNVWQTPTLGDLPVRAGYAEAKYTLPFGVYAAGRFDRMRFGEIANSLGKKVPWDSNVDRYEVGGGYRFDRNVLLKLVYQSTRTESSDDVYDRVSFFAAQASIGF
jgi:hypothetical protein